MQFSIKLIFPTIHIIFSTLFPGQCLSLYRNKKLLDMIGTVIDREVVFENDTYYGEAEKTRDFSHGMNRPKHM